MKAFSTVFVPGALLLAACGICWPLLLNAQPAKSVRVSLSSMDYKHINRSDDGGQICSLRWPKDQSCDPDSEEYNCSFEFEDYSVAQEAVRAELYMALPSGASSEEFEVWVDAVVASIAQNGSESAHLEECTISMSFESGEESCLVCVSDQTVSCEAVFYLIFLNESGEVVQEAVFGPLLTESHRVFAIADDLDFMQ